MTPSLLQALNVSCERGGRQLFLPISFSLAAGAALHLEGDNGAGKTTLLRSLSGLSPLSQGEVLWRGVPSHAAASGFKRELLYLGHALGLKDELTALENVQIALEVNDTAPKAARQRAMELLDYLGVAERANNLPVALSGGEQQRVAVARALANNPSLILADEPTAALDSQRGRQVMELFAKVAHERNAGVLVVTHDHRTLDVFDRIVDVEDGGITERPLSQLK
jgi:putative ABC transport system ATP-binding protein